MADNANQANEMEIQNRKIRENLDKIGRKIVIMSGKGGVGKTTVTVNLANALVDAGMTVGILDTDIHGPNVAKMLGCESSTLDSEDGESFIPVEPRKGLKVISLAFALQEADAPVVWRGPMKIAVIRQFLADVKWGTLDYLLIDTPPGTGDEPLTVCQEIPEMTGSVIVTTPQDVATMDARRSVNFSRRVGVPVLGIVENMSGLFCPDCGREIPVFGVGGGKRMAEEMNVPFLGRVPIEVDLRESEDNGVSYLQKSAESRSAKALKEIAEYIHNNTSASTAKDIHDYLGTSKCSPSACASCGSNCPSRKG